MKQQLLSEIKNATLEYLQSTVKLRQLLSQREVCEQVLNIPRDVNEIYCIATEISQRDIHAIDNISHDRFEINTPLEVKAFYHLWRDGNGTPEETTSSYKIFFSARSSRSKPFLINFPVFKVIDDH